MMPSDDRRGASANHWRSVLIGLLIAELLFIPLVAGAWVVVKT